MDRSSVLQIAERLSKMLQRLQILKEQVQIGSVAHPPDSTTDWAPTLDWPAMPATCGKWVPHCRQSMRSFHHSPTRTPCRSHRTMQCPQDRLK